MSRKQFMEGLREALEMKMSKSEIDAQIEFYTNYIKEEVKSGRSESEVIEDLGDPWAIAKNLRGPGEDNWNESETTQEGPVDYTTGDFGGQVYSTNSKWVVYGIILLILVIICTVLSVFFSIIRLLSPILMPILIVYFILKLLRR